MPSTTHDHAAYDENLLAAAPAATKAQLQSGYTTDLLDGKSGVAHPARRRGDVESGNAYAEKTATTTGTSSPTHTPVAPVPFYRTTKGRIIIAVGILIVLGAIIGGAVGGTRNSKKKDNGNSNGAASASQSAQSDPQQAGNTASSPATSTSGGLLSVPSGFGGTGTATAPTTPSTGVAQPVEPAPSGLVAPSGNLIISPSPTDPPQFQEIAPQR